MSKSAAKTRKNLYKSEDVHYNNLVMPHTLPMRQDISAKIIHQTEYLTEDTS